ncbi:unnamed protein product, partial [marine sediment metagenome]
VGQHTRLDSGGVPFSLGDLKPGAKLATDFYAEDYLGDGFSISERESRKKAWDRALCEISGPNGRATVVVKGNGRGGDTYPRGVTYTMQSDTGKGHIQVRTIRASLGGFDQVKSDKAWAELVLCGRITAMDPKTRLITIQQNRPEADDMIGHRLWQTADRSIEKHFPKTKAAVAKHRLATVKRWNNALAKGPVKRNVYLDDAVEIIIDGTWDHDFGELKIGDRIGVRYRIIQDDGKVIRPDWVRISRVPAVAAREKHP